MKKIIQYIIFIHRYFFPEKNEENSPGSPSPQKNIILRQSQAEFELEKNGEPQVEPMAETKDEPQTEANDEPEEEPQAEKREEPRVEPKADIKKMKKNPVKPETRKRPFGEVISDAEHLMAEKLYKEALALFRQLDSDLAGTGELMKIQFVRDRIESLLSRMKKNPEPESRDIIMEEDQADITEFETTLFEADNYYNHRLLNEALFLYRKLEKKWADKDDPQRKMLILKKISMVIENNDDPDEDVLPEPEKQPVVVYLDQEGSLTENKPQITDHQILPPVVAQPALPFMTKLLKQKILLNLLALVVFVMGIYCTFTRNIETVPPVETGEVIITTYYHGASAKDVENLVTVRIENIIQGLDSVKAVRSRSYRNVSSVAVSFIDHADYRELYSRLRTRVLNNKNSLPAGCDEPDFLFIDTQWLSSLIRLDLYGEASDTTRRWLGEKLKAHITAIEGIQGVDVSGEAENEFVVSLSPGKLQARGVTFSQAAQALRATGTNISTGRFDGKNSEFILDAGHIFSGQNDVLSTIIRQNKDGSFVRLSDVVDQAKVTPQIPTRIAAFNGKQSISLIIRKEKQASASELLKQIRQITAEFEAKHQADGIKITESSDSTLRISHASWLLRIQRVLGFALIFVILFYALGKKPALFTLVIIPFSLMLALIGMKLFEMSINTINLVAFIIISAVAVDLAVMVIDAVLRHKKDNDSMGQAVIEGTRELLRPLTSSMLIMCITFLPLFLLSGPTGNLLSVIPMTAFLTIVAVYLGNLCFLPTFVNQWGLNQDTVPLHLKKDDEKKVDTFGERLENLLKTFLKHPFLIIAPLAIACMIALACVIMTAAGSAKMIPFTSFPEQVFRYHITLAFPANTSIETTHKAIMDLSSSIMSRKDLKAESISGMAGYFEGKDNRVLQGNQYGQIVLNLPESDPDGDPQRRIDQIRTYLSTYFDQSYSKSEIRPKTSVFAEQNFLLSEKPLLIQFSGQNLEREIDLSTKIIEHINKQAVKDVVIGDGRTPKVNVVKYLPIQEKAFEMNVPPAQITEFIAGATNGIKVGIFRAASEEMALKLGITKNVKTPRDMLNLPIGNKGGAPVLLHHVVKVDNLSELDSRERYNGKPTVSVTAEIRPDSALTRSELTSLIMNYYASISGEYPDVTLTLGDETSQQTKSLIVFAMGSFVILLAMYLILALSMNDYIEPLIAFSACLIALAFVVIIIVITKITVSAWSLMALTGLCFIVLNTALVLMHALKRHISVGFSAKDAAVAAFRIRIKPSLITAAALTAGFLPMALGIPSSWKPWTSMALIMVVGLIPSTILVLLAVPVAHSGYAALKGKHQEQEQEQNE